MSTTTTTEQQQQAQTCPSHCPCPSPCQCPPPCPCGSVVNPVYSNDFSEYPSWSLKEYAKTALVGAVVGGAYTGALLLMMNTKCPLPASGATVAASIALGLHLTLDRIRGNI